LSESDKKHLASSDTKEKPPLGFMIISRQANEPARGTFPIVSEETMSQLLYFPAVSRQPYQHDDLAKSRGIAIAVIAGSIFWATMFIIAQWVFG
jgi:hypothetical protein